MRRGVQTVSRFGGTASVDAEEVQEVLDFSEEDFWCDHDGFLRSFFRVQNVLGVMSVR